MKQLFADFKNAWRAWKLELPVGKPWFRVAGKGVEPTSWEGLAAFYVIVTWIIGGSYYAVTGRDPLGLPIGGGPLLGFASLAVFLVCALICILKTDFSRNSE